MARGLATVAIVGGGPAGCAAALHLARGGAEVTLFEREPSAHDKVCGEFLSTEAIDELHALELDPFTLGASSIDRVRLVARERDASGALPFRAAGLSRRILDEALLAAAASRGVDVRRGVAVRALERRPTRVALTLTDGSRHIASQVLLANGKHELRGWARKDAVPRGATLAFKMHFEAPADQLRALANHVELHLFRGGYAGLQLVEGGTMNLCLVVRPALFVALDSDFTRLVAHLTPAGSVLATRLVAARAMWARPLAIARVPYGWTARPRDATASIFRLGDQAAVTPSFTGDGMAIALTSGRLAAAAIVAGDDGRDYARSIAATVNKQVRRASFGLGLLRTAPQLAVRTARSMPMLLSRGAALTRLR